MVHALRDTHHSQNRSAQYEVDSNFLTLKTYY